MTTAEHRLPTRQTLLPDLPAFDPGVLDQETRDALAELLLAMADDEFICGFWDSEWTGIAPLLEEDVAFSSLAQDEIGHARLLYEMYGRLTGADPDRTAFLRAPEEYRHARLLDHPRTDWAFSICRRWLYDTADAIRLAALAGSSFKPLADVVAKIRREERYHLMHLDAWMRRLAAHDGEPRAKLESSLAALAPDALTVFAPLSGEKLLVAAGVLAQPMVELAERWSSEVGGMLAQMGLAKTAFGRPRADGRDHSHPAESFLWLWGEFTSVARSEEGVEW
jgi:ring-1,2-phenylacetyl-CoA epoxidase subunit PaaC